MASIKVCDPVSVPVSVLQELQELRAELRQLRQDNDRLRQENDQLRRDNERLQQQLEQTRAELEQVRRQGKRQAAPFSKGPPKAQPKTPGRKRGAAHGRHGHRLCPPPEQVDEILEAPLPAACPHCGAAVEETEVRQQRHTELPRGPHLRPFNVPLGVCAGCGCRLQGRPPLQTSDALGAAASQLGPDAQAAVVTLNKTYGLSHVKVAGVFEALLGISLT